MKEFAHLVYDNDQTKNSQDKVDILIGYFKNAPQEDILWAIALLSGKRPKRVLTIDKIREWGAEHSSIPLWLFTECENIVGDKSETLSLILPDPKTQNAESLTYWVNSLISFSGKTEEEIKEALFAAWDSMGQKEKYVFGKLLSATFRVNILQGLIVRALSKHTGIGPATLTHRLSRKWEPGKTTFQELILNTDSLEEISKPYSFSLASIRNADIKELGKPDEWVAEWKYDGIRAQIIKRKGQIFIWNKSEELITGKFPELEELKNKLPDGCVIDGVIVPFADGKILASSVLQTRLIRKTLSVQILKETTTGIIVFDLLEYEGADIRNGPLIERRKLLARLIEEINAKTFIQISHEIAFNSWEELDTKRLQARENMANGIMIKRKESAYSNNLSDNNWWQWKTDPLSIDGVLIYAAQGTGRHANLFTEYTFGVWNGNELITFAKANSGLSNREIIEIDSWVKENMVEKFGPVRTVKPALVFEIGFDAIQLSARHKSGVTLAAPRIFRWRKDKKPEDAGTLEGLKAILENVSLES